MKMYVLNTDKRGTVGVFTSARKAFENLKRKAKRDERISPDILHRAEKKLLKIRQGKIERLVVGEGYASIHAFPVYQ